MEDDGEDGAFDVSAVKTMVTKVAPCPNALYCGHLSAVRPTCTCLRLCWQICKALLMGGVNNEVPVPFQHVKVPQWTTTIVENTLKELAIANGDAAKNGQQKYKYVGEQAGSETCGAPVQLSIR